MASGAPKTIYTVSEVLAAANEGRLAFNTKRIRKGGNGTAFFDATIDGKPAGQFRFFDIRQCGQVAARTAEDLAVQNAKLPQGWSPLLIRDRPASLQVNKFASAKGGDGKSHPTGEPNELFLLLEAVSRVFRANIEAAIADGTIFVKDVSVGKPGPGAVIATNGKIVSLIQTATKEFVDLENPIARMRIKIADKQTGELGCAFSDKKKPYEDAAGRPRFEAWVDEDGNSVTDFNVHKVVVSGSRIDGLVKFSGCISSMGISPLMDVAVAIVEPPAAYSAPSQDDVYGDEPPPVRAAAARPTVDDFYGDEEPAGAAAAATTAADPAAVDDLASALASLQ